MSKNFGGRLVCWTGRAGLGWALVDSWVTGGGSSSDGCFTGTYLFFCRTCRLVNSGSRSY